jgi:hypothetical protein
VLVASDWALDMLFPRIWSTFERRDSFPISGGTGIAETSLDHLLVSLHTSIEAQTSPLGAVPGRILVDTVEPMSKFETGPGCPQDM